MNPAADPRQPSSRVEALDGLRFLAAFAVVLYHYAFRAWNEDTPGVVEYALLGSLSRYGYLGVDLFFVISGFVILMSASKGDVGAFVLSRVVRLYPAYWFCALATFTFVSWWQASGGKRPSAVDLAFNLTMLQSFFHVRHLDGVYWSLVVELHFYALMLLVLWARQLPRIDIVLGVWLAAGIAADFLPRLHPFGHLYAAEWCHYFVAGALAYRMRTAGFSALRLVLYGVSYAQAARHAHWYVALKERLTQVPHEPIVVQVIVASIYLVFLLLALDRLRLRWSAMAQAGAMTYPLYLIHGVIGTTILVHWVRGSTVDRWLALSVVTAGALAAAWVIQRFVEQPLGPRLRKAVGGRFVRDRTAGRACR